jgi:predicted extracellular nuclease
MKATKALSRLFSISVCLAMLLSALPMQPAYAIPPDIVISQVYGGGGNSGGVYTNDFVELFNRGTTTVSLAGWSVQYASATGTGNFGSSTTMITPLSGSLTPGQYLLVQEAAGANVFAPLPTPDVTDTSPIAIAATGGKVALVNTTTPLGCNGGSTACSTAALATIIDLIGWDGANFYETTGVIGTGPAPATTNSTAVLRNLGGCMDTDNNAANFFVGVPNPRNTSSPITDCTLPAAIGTAAPNMLFVGDSTKLTVVVYPGNPAKTGWMVTCDLGSIGGPATQSYFDDGTNGDVIAGDNTFSFATSIANGTSGGVYGLACTINDNQAYMISATISLMVVPLPIGTVNGPVGDTDNGATHTSPFAGQTVIVQGVIYEKTLQATSGSFTYNGFFIQNTAVTADTDPNTSDGLFVYMGTDSTLPRPSGTYPPAVGDEIILKGVVSEYYNMTELVSPFLVLSVVRSGVDVEAELPPVVADPPTSLVDANRYWERLQGMRVQVPVNSIVLGGRNVFSPADAEVWVARSDSTIAQRSNLYERRAFRDAHPLDDNYNPTNWDGNGYRILMGSLGIKGTLGDAQTLIEPARTFDTVTNAPSGGLNYTFSKYRIEITEQPVLNVGDDPALNNPPSEIADRSVEYSIVDYNLENLYDYRDNPFSMCDFANVPPGSNPSCSNTGTPFLSSITPPYDYVPASDAAYQARMSDIADQIINDLHSPDILLVQEVENQDICSVTSGALTCGSTDNADGKPDVLQELALKVVSLGGPAYEAAFDRDSSDLRGIAPAFLYRTDRVKLLSPVGDPVLGASPIIDGYTAVAYNSDISNPKALNAVLPDGISACETNWVFPRAPGIALFRIYNTSLVDSLYQDVYAINNHFKSGPDTCVAHRTEQAKYNAALVAYIQAARPDARIVTGGDLNVYPRPDDIAFGASDQLGSLYAPSLSLVNLWDVLMGVAPESAYSYVYLGMAQTLDQMYVNQPMQAALQQFRIAHINSDFPADYPDDVARGTSDHDPNVATFHTIFNWSGFFQPIANPPALNTVKAGSAIPIKFSLSGNQGMDIIYSGYPVSQKINCTTLAPLNNPPVQAVIIDSSYDPLVDQYIFNWKTSATWKNTCQKLTVQLIDGTIHIAYFKFKK